MAKKTKKVKKPNRRVAPKKKTRKATPVAAPKTSQAYLHEIVGKYGDNIPAGRDIPDPRLSRNTSSDPSGNKLALKIAGCAPDPELIPATIEFAPSRVLKVEERFTRGYDPAKVGEAKVESQMEFETVSNGWWVVLEGWPIGFKVGDSRPDINPGDRMKIAMLKVPT